MKSLLGLVLLLLAAAPIFGQTFINPSFETDTFTVFPGYISGNPPGITGWTATDNTRAGINPGGGSPFADNGTIPNGSKVGFIQSGGAGGYTALSTVISGLTSGTTYTVNFRANARNGQTAKCRIGVDGAAIMSMDVSSVGGSNPYKYVAFDFTAAAATATLSLTNDAGGDNTLLIDDFTIAASNGNMSYAAWNDDASSGVDSTYIYTHAYNFNSGNSAFVNNIRFTGVGGGNPAVAGWFSTANMPNTYGPYGNNVTGGSATLANAFIYAGGNPQSITINGLVPGRQYVATIYGVAFDAAPATRAATFVVGTDRMTVDLDKFGNGNGIRVSCHYTADGSGSATINYTWLGSGSFHTCGFCNRETAVTANPWTYAAWSTDGNSGISDVYQYSHAYRFGSANGAFVNGVSFTGAGTSVNPSANGSFAVTGGGSLFGADGGASVVGGGNALVSSFPAYPVA